MLGVLLLSTIVLSERDVGADEKATATLTEAEVVRAARERPELAAVRQGGVAVARAERREARQWPNPEVSYSREQMFGIDGGVDDYLSITQELDLSGRRGLRARAAGERVRAASLEGEALVRAAEKRARQHFFEALCQQRRLEAIQEWNASIEAVVETVRKRETAGDASAYERLRLERELENGRSRTHEVEAELGRAWAHLWALLDPYADSARPRRRIEGALLPVQTLPPLSELMASVGAHPSLRAIAASAEAARLDSRAAARGWVPGLTLGIGWKSSDVGPERHHGFTALAAVSLPLFDRGQAASTRAAAEKRRLEGELALARAEVAAEARGLATAAASLADGARRFRENTQAASRELLRTAEAAYRGGEVGVLELIDAYRGALDDELRALELELAARRARLELEYATGGESR